MHNLFQKWACRGNSSSFHTSWPEKCCSALILQHYWQDLKTCPKAVGARGTKTAVKRVSRSVSTGAEMHIAFPGEKWTVTSIISPPRQETITWPSQGARLLTTTYLLHQRLEQANTRVYSLSPLLRLRWRVGTVTSRAMPHFAECRGFHQPSAT